MGKYGDVMTNNPHALENLPALDHEAGLLDQSPTTQAYADEILRRMAR